MVKIFDLTHPNCVAVFVFNWSSAHEGFAVTGVDPIMIRQLLSTELVTAAL